jgi:hypothetical protein
VRIRRSPEESASDPFKLSADAIRSLPDICGRSDRWFIEKSATAFAAGGFAHSRSISSTNALTLSSDRAADVAAAIIWRQPALPCTFWSRLKTWRLAMSILRATLNRRFWDALSTSPQAGCSARSQGLWTLWATPSVSFVELLTSIFNSVARRERPALPALRVTRAGPAPRRDRPLVHVQWGVAPRAPVQGR